MVMQELIDITIDHYHIERLLAHGGMSEVYLAHDTRTDQIVAMKMVRRSAGEYYERFLREAKATTKLKHDHILPALDSGEYEHWAYMVTPYIQEGTLTQRLARGPLSMEEAEHFLDQLASALQFAHEHGVLHRDIKSSNVLLEGDHAYLTDFGLVKSTEDDFSLTRSGFLIGTPEYMAPELVEDCATPLSDIYAMGVLLFQMVTGSLPFKGGNPVSIVMKHLREAPPKPSKFNPAIPADAERVILQTLNKDPQRRFRTARALANAFKQALHPEAVESLRTNNSTAPATINVVPRASTSLKEQHVSTPLSRGTRLGLLIGVAVLLLLLLIWALTSAFTQSHSQHHPGANHIPAITTHV